MQNYIVDTISLRKRMIDQGYTTISSLSEASSVGRNTLGKILDGRIRPSADVMDKLSLTLRMSPEQAGSIFFAQNLRDT